MTGLQGLGVVFGVILWTLETMCLFVWWIEATHRDKGAFGSPGREAVWVFVLSTLAWLAVIAHIVRVW